MSDASDAWYRSRDQQEAIRNYWRRKYSILLWEYRAMWFLWFLTIIALVISVLRSGTG